MKITFATLSFLLLFIPAFSQEDAPSWFRIGIKASPDVTFRTLYNDNKENEPIKEMRDDIEIPKMGYTTGISTGFRLGKHLELETGVYYSAKGFRTEKMDFGYPPIEDPAAADYSQLIYSYGYLDIPATLNAFFFTNSKLQLIATVSFTTNLLLKKREVNKLYYDNKEEVVDLYSTAEYEPYTFTAEAGAGISWNLSTHFQLRAVPTFRYGLTKINDDPITAHLWSSGLMIGFHYLF